MSSWSEVRRIASLLHDALSGNSSTLVSADSLLKAAQVKTGIKIVGRPAGDSLLDGAEAAYDRDRKRIYFSKATNPQLLHFHIAHEFGHHYLNQAASACTSNDLDQMTPAEPEMSAVGDQDSYSPKERAEAQANLFAREFLLPRKKLRARCEYGIPDADSIAAEVGVPVELVMQQLADALLLPPERETVEEVRVEEAPDDSQKEAITASDKPRQVRAGPGTGKTRTLVGRVAHLIERGEDPASILALTYSNLSGRDLANRIRREIGEKATAVWSGTFHAYGLELLRKHGHLLGFGGEPKPLDRTDGLMLLEDLLPQLELNHYLDLHEPMLKLRSILGAIGRAKDELASPEEYLDCARSMAEEANDAESELMAAKAIEVAQIYQVYEAALRQRNSVDFGDLIALPVKLLREHPNVREAIRTEKRHILVDEYQDMNRASGLFLKELCSPGQGPWVVGDVRQSIYRFRGASPLNMTKFKEEFEGAETTDLAVNYRSHGKIVRLFQAFGNQMSSGDSTPQATLTAHRGENLGTIQYDVATTREAEARGIAKEILSRKSKGTPFSHHAVLGRSHTILSRLARELEGAGVPCLYFGDFFERPEIRDLLSLLSFVSEKRGIGILRVAQFPGYSVPPEDIQLLFEKRRVLEGTMLEVVRDFAKVDGLSEKGCEGLSRLVADIEDADWKIGPHRLLMAYLFRRSKYLQPLLADKTVPAQQRRLAIYQLLQFAFSFKAEPKQNPKQLFLAHVRRLEILDEEKQLRQLPEAASNIDAVRLMTVHASKGLEFPVVHILSLTASQFPARARHEPCPLPDGLISTDALMKPIAEEHSLFFVATSRARDNLHLSRAKTNGLVNAKPSPLLSPIANHLPSQIEVNPTWLEAGIPGVKSPLLLGRDTNNQWTARELETYLECPRRYYYEHSLQLGGTDAASPFLKFQSALHSSMAWLRSTPSMEERAKGLEERFQEDWVNFGPGEHPFEPLYRRMAQIMIKNAQSVMSGESLVVERSMVLPRGGLTVSCRADHVERTPQGIIIRRLKAGRLAKTEEGKLRYALLQAAIQSDHPNENVHFEHVSLLTGERRVATDKSTKILENIEACHDAINRVGEGSFEPTPGQGCPSCPYFFICPSHGATR